MGAIAGRAQHYLDALATIGSRRQRTHHCGRNLQILRRRRLQPELAAGIARRSIGHANRDLLASERLQQRVGKPASRAVASRDHP